MKKYFQGHIMTDQQHCVTSTISLNTQSLCSAAQLIYKTTLDMFMHFQYWIRYWKP